MAEAKKRSFSGFYGMDDGSTVLIGDANNPRLPKGKEGSVFYSVMDRDGKLALSGSYDYGSDGLEGIRKEIGRKSGRSITNMIADPKSQQFKRMRGSMSNPEKFLQAVSGLPAPPKKTAEKEPEPVKEKPKKAVPKKTERVFNVPKNGPFKAIGKEYWEWSNPKTPWYKALIAVREGKTEPFLLVTCLMELNDPKVHNPTMDVMQLPIDTPFEEIDAMIARSAVFNKPKKEDGRRKPRKSDPDEPKPKAAPSPAPKKAQKGKRTVTEHEFKHADFEGFMYQPMIPSGRNRWINSFDDDGKISMEAVYDPGTKEYITRWKIKDGKETVRKFEHGYDASDYLNDIYKGYLKKNGLKPEPIPLNFERPEPKTNRLEHFVPDPKNRKSILGDPYKPIDDRHGRYKPKVVYLKDDTYDEETDSTSGYSGPAKSLKDAEMNIIRHTDRRFAPSEYALIEPTVRGDDTGTFIDEYGFSYCPNCGFGKYRKKDRLCICSVCGCAFAPESAHVDMSQWDHSTYNEYRDRIERERYRKFANGFDWMPISIDGKKIEYRKSNFDSDHYNVLYEPDMEKYDRRCSKILTFNRRRRSR